MNLDADIKRKETVRVSKKDLLKLLAENEQMSAHITDLQTRMTELVEENRRLKTEKLNRVMEEEDPPFPEYEPPNSMPFIDPNIYFDGSNGLR